MNPSAVPFVPTWLRNNNASASPSNNNLDISDDSHVQFEFEDDGGFGGGHAREARAFSHASSSSSLAGSRDGTSTPNQGFGSPVQTAFAGLSLRGSGSQPTTPSRRTHSAQPYLPYGDSKPMLIKTKSMTDAAALHNLVGPSSMQTPPLSTSGSSLTEALRGAPGLAPAPAPSSPARGLAASVDDDDLNDAGAVDAQRTAVEVEEEAAAPAVASTDDEVADALDDVPAPTTSSSPPRTTLRIDPNKPVGPDDFEVLCVVGQGAFGKVFQVRRIGDGRIYAMKVMRKDRIISRMQGYFDDAAAAAAAAADDDDGGGDATASNPRIARDVSKSHGERRLDAGGSAKHAEHAEYRAGCEKRMLDAAAHIYRARHPDAREAPVHRRAAVLVPDAGEALPGSRLHQRWSPLLPAVSSWHVQRSVGSRLRRRTCPCHWPPPPAWHPSPRS
ncbi:serine/threonine-protein kinase [Pycnococcus provasolii]